MTLYNWKVIRYYVRQGRIQDLSERGGGIQNMENYKISKKNLNLFNWFNEIFLRVW